MTELFTKAPEILSTIAGCSALFAALVALWSAANVERLKSKFEIQRHELNSQLQKSLEDVKLEGDRDRKAYELHVKKEYELYEGIYPELIDAYYAFISTKKIDEEPDILEELSPSGDERTKKEIEDLRHGNLSEALERLHFIDPIIKKKPFINHEVFSEIETFWEMGMDTYLVRNYPALYSPPFSVDRNEHSEEELKAQLDIICKLIKQRLRVIDA